MAFDGTIFDMANRTIFHDPHMGGVRATYIDGKGRRQQVLLLDSKVSEIESFGSATNRTPSEIKLLRRSEVPDRPVKGSTVDWSGQKWAVKHADLDSENLNWRLDLEMVRGS